MDRIKPYLESAEKNIRAKNFQAALGDAETALLFMSANFQANLYAGRCAIELKKYDQAEGYIKQALGSKPDDLNCLKSLCMIYKQTGQTDEYFKALRDIANIFKKKGDFGQYYEQVMKMYEKLNTDKNFVELGKIYEELVACEGIEAEKKRDLHLRFFRDAFGNIDYGNTLSQKMLTNALQNSSSMSEQEEIIEKSIPFYQHTFIKKGKSKEFYDNLLKMDKDAPKSIILLKYKIEYADVILEQKDKLLDLYQEVVCFMLFNLVFPSIPENVLNEAKNVPAWKRYLKYENLSLANKPVFNDINNYALVFQKACEQANLNNLVFNDQASKVLQNIPKANIDQCFQACEKLTFVFTYPVQIAYYLSTDQKDQAREKHKEFYQAIEKIRSLYSISLLEEIHASLGLEIGLNPADLIVASNNFKALLKKDPDNIENLKVFYRYQTNIIRELRKIDEDLNLFNVVSSILDKEPNDPFYLSEKAWLIFSNQNLNEKFSEIETLLNKALDSIESLNQHLQAQVYLRLASLYLIKDPSGKENLDKVRELYLKAWQLDPHDTKCFKAQALLYSIYDKDYIKALKCLTNSFDIQKADEDFYKLQFFLLMKLNLKEQATTLLKAVYKLFKNSFWINYTLGLLLMDVQDHTRSLALITRACELYDYYRKEKPLLNYQTFKEYNLRYLVKTQGIGYADDIPAPSDIFYQTNDAKTLSDTFFAQEDPITEFHLYYIYCQLNKNLGRIGSAFKTLEKLEQCLEKTEKVSLTDIYEGTFAKNEAFQRFEGLLTAQKLIQEEFLIIGRGGLPSEDKNLTGYDMRKYSIEVLIYYIAKATISFYLCNYNECFISITTALQYFMVLHKWKLTGINYKKAAILERELVGVICEVSLKYSQNTLAKEVVDIAIHRVDTALKIIECCQEVLKEDISVSNIYLNRSLSDLYLFKGLHGSSDEALEKAEEYLQRIMRLSLVEYDQIEKGTYEKQGEIKDSMLEEGKCAKSQEVIYDGLYNIALINLNLAHRKASSSSRLEKARNLAKFGIKSFNNNSSFWLLYAFTEDTNKKKKAAILSGISADPKNIEAINALSYTLLKEKKMSFAIKLLLKSLELDTLENYKAFNGLGLINSILGLEILQRKNGTIEGKKKYTRDLFEYAKQFFDKAYFYSLNSQEITQTSVTEKFQAIYFYICGDYIKAVEHFENYYRYKSHQAKDDINTDDSIFWQYYVLSLIKSGRKGLFTPNIPKDSLLTPDMLALVDKNTPNDHQYKDKFYSQFIQSLSQTKNHESLANLLLDELDKRFEEWNAQSTEWLTKGSSGQTNLHTAFIRFSTILNLVNTIGSLYLIDKQYQDCYAFLTDHLSLIGNIVNLPKLEKYQTEYLSLTNEYQKILSLYLNCLVLTIKHNQAKDPAKVHEDFEVVIKALSDNYATGNKGPSNLIFNKAPKTESDSLSTIELLRGISYILIGDLPQAKVSLLKALRSDCESQLVRRILSLYYVLHERKGSVISDYNLATFDEYKVRRDHDLDSTSNINKARPLYLDLIGEQSSSYALIQYLEEYNRCENADKRRKLITRAAIYLHDISVWLIYCVEMLQNADERTPRRLHHLLSVLNRKVITEILNIKSTERRDGYNKVLKKAVKLAYEISLLHETSDFSEKEETSQEVKELIGQVDTAAKEVLGDQKLAAYRKKLDLFYNTEKISAIGAGELQGLFKNDISSLLFAKEIVVKLYEKNWNGDIEGLLKNLRQQFIDTIQAKEQGEKFIRTSRVKLEEGLLQVELMLYTILLRQAVRTEGNAEENVNALEKLGEVFEWCRTHVNRNKQVYTLLINHFHQIGDSDSVEAYLTTLNYVECPENVTQIANLYCMLAFYNKVRNESTPAEEKDELFENIELLSEDILANVTEASYVIGVTYYVKGLCELMKAENSQSINTRKVKSTFAKAALFAPAHARAILKNFAQN